MSAEPSKSTESTRQRRRRVGFQCRLFAILAFASSLPAGGSPPLLLELRTPELPPKQELASREWSVRLHPELLANGNRVVVGLPGRSYETTLHSLADRGSTAALSDAQSWRGELEWNGSTSGHLLLTRRGAHVAGWLQTELGTFHLLPEVASAHRLLEVDWDLLGPQFCSVETSRAADAAKIPGPSAGYEKEDAPVTVSVLVLYTSEARRQAGGPNAIETAIDHAVDFTNMALENSRVDARLELVHVEEIAYSPSLLDIREDVGFLITSTSVAELRQRFHADQVGLIKAACETGCGFAAGMKRSDFGAAAAPIAYFVASFPALPENFAHELAHNFGCQHEPQNADPPSVAAFPFGYAHFEPGVFRTLVESFNGLCDGCPVLPQYSNPDVLYQGLPTGIVDQRDNARAIELIAPTVARFGDLAGKATFTREELRISEGAGPVTVEVWRLEGSMGAVSVELRSRDGVAGAGRDFRGVRQRLSWANGEAEVRGVSQLEAARRRIRLELLDDDLVEGDESFTLVLADPVGGVELGQPSTLRVVIEDDDVGARFTTPEVEVVEGETSTLEVVRVGSTDEALDVEVRSTGGSATRGLDYRFSPVPLHWAAHDTGARTVAVPTLDDAELEGNETLDLQITIGSQVVSTAVVDLLDDDGDRTPCSTDAPNLCLGDGRFRVEVEYRSEAGGATAAATPIQLSDSSGLFWFYDEGNIEMLLKVLDACELPDFQTFWVFYAATTDRGFRVRVTDVATGRIRDYENDLGKAARPVTDTAAFATCGAAALPPSDDGAGTIVAAQAASGGEICPDEPSALCLDAGRFRVGVSFDAGGGEPSDARPVGLSDSSGLFWFYDEGNIEMLLKVLDACALPDFQTFWVFYAATTDRGFSVRVHDQVSGKMKEYTNPTGIAALPVTDTAAFACASP